MRPTIPWKLVCDRDLISREQAAEIFSMRLDTLGFMDYVIAIAVCVMLLVLLPFLFFCCNCTGTNAYVYSEYEPFFTRALYLAAFLGMLHFVNIEREQCDDNKERLLEFHKTNDCGDEYMHMDTNKVNERLDQAEITLDSMEMAILFAIGFLIFEVVMLCCFRFCIKMSK